MVLTAGAKEEAEPGSPAATTSPRARPASASRSTSASPASSSASSAPTGRAPASCASRTGKLTGDVSCAEGGQQPLDSTVEGRADQGHDRRRAALRGVRREPPDAGRPEAGAARLGRRRVQARAALGLPGREDRAHRVLEGARARGQGRQRRARLRRRGQDHRHGHLRERRRGRGHRRRLQPRHRPHAGRATQAPEGAPPTEKVVAQKIREFPKLLAAFFIAVAVVMLAARLIGLLAVQDRPAARDGRGARRDPARPDAASAQLLPELQRARLPAGRHPLHRGRGQPRPDLLHVPGRARDRPLAAQGRGSPRRRRSPTPAWRSR